MKIKMKIKKEERVTCHHLGMEEISRQFKLIILLDQHPGEGMFYKVN
jgi:hypothetical protein